MKLVTARDYIGQYGRIEAHPSHPGPAGSVLAWVVPVEPDYDEAKDALDLIDAYLSIVRNILGVGEETP